MTCRRCLSHVLAKITGVVLVIYHILSTCIMHFRYSCANHGFIMGVGNCCLLLPQCFSLNYAKIGTFITKFSLPCLHFPPSTVAIFISYDITYKIIIQQSMFLEKRFLFDSYRIFCGGTYVLLLAFCLKLISFRSGLPQLPHI